MDQLLLANSVSCAVINCVCYLVSSPLCAASLSYAERCELNFGARPFEHPVEGFQPMQAAPSASQQALAADLMGCMVRLAKAVAAAESAASSAGAGAAAAAASGSAGAGGAAAAGPGGSAGVGTAQAAVNSLSWDDATLLAGALCHHLAPLLAQSYHVAGSLLPALMALHGRGAPHAPEPTLALMRLLHVALPGTHGRSKGQWLAMGSFKGAVAHARSMHRQGRVIQPGAEPFTCPPQDVLAQPRLATNTNSTKHCANAALLHRKTVLPLHWSPAPQAPCTARW